MYKLSITDINKCVKCGNCDFAIPDRLEILRTYGYALITKENVEKHNTEIQQAIKNCHLDLLELNPFTVSLK